MGLTEKTEKMEKLEGQVDKTKEIALRNKSDKGRKKKVMCNMRLKQDRETCKSGLSRTSSNRSNRQIERETSRQVKRVNTSDFILIFVKFFSKFLRSGIFGKRLSVISSLSLHAIICKLILRKLSRIILNQYEIFQKIHIVLHETVVYLK